MRIFAGLANFVAYMNRMQAKARARFAFSEFLGGSGKRCTPERLVVLDAVMDQRLPFTAEGLLEQCAAQPGISICRATLFNTLPLLIQGGFVRRVSVDGQTTYEAVRPGNQLKPMAYMICSACGKTRRVDAPALGRMAAELSPRGFAADSDSAIAYVHGLCSGCRRKNKENN